MTVGSLKTVVLDVPDLAELTAFYEQVAGWRRHRQDDEDDWRTLLTGDGQRVGLQRAGQYVACPQQGRLEIGVPDLGAAVRRLGGQITADPAGHPLNLVAAATATLRSVVLFCPDAPALRHFYDQLVGPGLLAFEQVAGYTAPRWPDPAYPQRLHLDIAVGDIEVAEPAALALGATRLDGEGPDWRVYADPAGKPFCLLWPAP